MAVTFPTKFDVREARDQAGKAVADAVDPLRAPSLALLGLGDYAVASAHEAFRRSSPAPPRSRPASRTCPPSCRSCATSSPPRTSAASPTPTSPRSAASTTTSVKRGTSAYSKIKAQPQVKQALDTVDTVSTEIEGRLEDTVEEVRVRGESVSPGSPSRPARSASAPRATPSRSPARPPRR